MVPKPSVGSHPQSAHTLSSSSLTSASPAKPWERGNSNPPGTGIHSPPTSRGVSSNQNVTFNRTGGGGGGGGGQSAVRRMSSAQQGSSNSSSNGMVTSSSEPQQGSTLNTSSTLSEQDASYSPQSRYSSTSVDRYPYGTYGSRYGSAYGTTGGMYGGGGMYGSRYGSYGGYGSGMYGGGYGSSMYGGYGGMYGGGYGGFNRGMGMMGPEGGIGWLQNVYHLVSSLGQMTELLGMNTEALGYLFGTLMGFLETVGNLVSQVARPALGSSTTEDEGTAGDGVVQVRERSASARVKLLRWIVGLVTTYLAYRLLRRASRWVLGSVAAAGVGALTAGEGSSNNNHHNNNYHRQLSDAALEQAFMSGQQPQSSRYYQRGPPMGGYGYNPSSSY